MRAAAATSALHLLDLRLARFHPGHEAQRHLLVHAGRREIRLRVGQGGPGQRIDRSAHRLSKFQDLLARCLHHSSRRRHLIEQFILSLDDHATLFAKFLVIHVSVLAPQVPGRYENVFLRLLKVAVLHGATPTSSSSGEGLAVFAPERSDLEKIWVAHDLVFAAVRLRVRRPDGPGDEVADLETQVLEHNLVVAFGFQNQVAVLVHHNTDRLPARYFILQAKLVEAVVVAHIEVEGDLLKHGHFVVPPREIDADFWRLVPRHGDGVFGIVFAWRVFLIDELDAVSVVPGDRQRDMPSVVCAQFERDPLAAVKNELSSFDRFVNPDFHVDFGAFDSGDVTAVRHLARRPSKIIRIVINQVDTFDFSGSPCGNLIYRRPAAAVPDLILYAGLDAHELVVEHIVIAGPLDTRLLPHAAGHSPSHLERAIALLRADPHHEVVPDAYSHVAGLNGKGQRDYLSHSVGKYELNARQPEMAEQVDNDCGR